MEMLLAARKKTYKRSHRISATATVAPRHSELSTIGLDNAAQAMDRAARDLAAALPAGRQYALERLLDNRTYGSVARKTTKLSCSPPSRGIRKVGTDRWYAFFLQLQNTDSDQQMEELWREVNETWSGTDVVSVNEMRSALDLVEWLMYMC